MGEYMKLLAFLIPTFLLAAPAQVILLPPAEKTDNSLSLKGRKRAAALVPFFESDPKVSIYGKPVALFATDRHSQLTLEPFARSADIPFKQSANIAQELLTNPDYEGNFVLVCTPNIDTLAAQLGAKKAKAIAADHYLVLTFNEEGAPTIQTLPQKLLYGDTK